MGSGPDRFGAVTRRGVKCRIHTAGFGYPAPVMDGLDDDRRTGSSRFVKHRKEQADGAGADHHNTFPRRDLIVNLVVQLDHLPQFGRLEHLPLPRELCLADVAGDVLHLEELQRGFSGRLDRRTSRVIFAYRRRVEVPIAEESVDGVDVSRVVV